MSSPAALLITASMIFASIADGRTQDKGSDRITIGELRRVISTGDALLVDVREEALFKLGHLPGALHLPLERVNGFLKDGSEKARNQKRLYVVYCNCAGETASLRVVRLLRNGGVARAVALAGGIRAWVDSGGDLVRAPSPASR